MIDQFSNPSKDVIKKSKELEKSFSDAGKALKSTGDFFSSTGMGLTKSVTVPVAGIATATGKMALDFENSIAKVSTIADSTEVPIGEMKSAIMELSDTTGIAAGDIANNVYDAISAGQKTGDAVSFVSNSTKLAKAGFADSSSALDILTTTLNAYGMEADKVGKVSDILIQTQNLGKTTVGELSSTMGKIIPTAKSNGVAFEQVAAGYAVMTSKGIATAETTTYMNSMLNELGKSGTGVAKALKDKTGKSFDELMGEGKSLSDVLAIVSDCAKDQGVKFGDLWSSAEAGKAALTLLGDGAEGFNGVLSQMETSTGATDAAFDKMQTNGFSIEKTLNTLKNTGIELGGTILEMVSPAIEFIADKVSGLSKWFRSLSDEQKKSIVKFVGIAAAIGPLALAFGKMISVTGDGTISFGKLGGALTRAGGFFKAFVGPVGIVVAAVAAGAVLVYRNWDSIAPVFQKIGAKVQGFWSAAQPAISAFMKIVEEIGKVLMPILDSAFKVAFEGIGGYISSFLDTATEVIGGITKVFEGIIDFVSGVFTGNWEQAWNGVKSIFSGVFEALVGIVKAPMNGIIGVINGVIHGINKLKIKIPKWSPWNPGKTFGINIPELPKLYVGTDNWRGGPAVIHDKGGEIVDLPKGTRVYPHDESVQMARAEGGKTVNIHIPKLAETLVVREDADIDRIAEALLRKLQQVNVNMA